MMKGIVNAMALVAVMVLSSEALAEKKAFDKTPREVSGVVNINTATVKELELLPGVGNKTAKLIVAYREKQQFKTAQEIVRVHGVGQGIFKRIKDYLTVSGPTTIAVKPRAHANAAAGEAKPAPALAKN